MLLMALNTADITRYPPACYPYSLLPHLKNLGQALEQLTVTDRAHKQSCSLD